MKHPLAARLRHLCSRRPFAVSVAAVLLAVAPVLALYTPFFETNDDAVMMLTLAGRVLSSEPTAHVIYMHILLSGALAALYGLASGVPWYAWMLLGSTILALVAILWALLRDGVSARRFGLYLVCLAFLGLPFLLRLQFTRVSILVGLSGVFLLWTALEGRRRAGAWSPRAMAPLVGGLLLLTLSFMIRRDGALLALTLALPALLYLTTRFLAARSLRPLLTTLVLVGGLLVTLDLLQTWAYGRDPDWRRFGELTWLQGTFIDFGWSHYDQSTRPFFDAVGWSENDHAMLRSRFYVDPELFSLEKMRRVSSYFTPHREGLAGRFRAAAVYLAPHIGRSHGFWIGLLLAAGIALLEIRDRSRLLILAATVLLCVLLLVALLAFQKLPLRISELALGGVCLIALMLASGREPPPRRRWLELSGFLLVAGAVGWIAVLGGVPTSSIRQQSRAAALNNHYLRQALNELEPRPSRTYVSWGSGFPFEFVLPLEDKAYLDGLRIVAVGGGNRSPVQTRMMEMQGISDLPLALLEREDVYLFITRADSDRGFHALLQTYMQEHYGERIVLRSLYRQGDLNVWKMTPAG